MRNSQTLLFSPQWKTRLVTCLALCALFMPGLMGTSFAKAPKSPPHKGKVAAKNVGETAQQPAKGEGANQTEQEQEAEQEAEKEITPDTIPSLFFTYWEHATIQDAKKERARSGVRQAPTTSQLNQDLWKATPQTDEKKPPPPPEQRELRLGGIVYVSKEDWTIWLNEQRVTPKAVPPQVIDLRVYDDHIDVKWLDDYTNQIFPLRLRPQQRFNFDSRIFLPG